MDLDITQEELDDQRVAAAIAGDADEDPDDESTWHEDPDPTHRGFDWHMLFIGLILALVLAWGAHKVDTLRLNTHEVTTCSTKVI